MKRFITLSVAAFMLLSLILPKFLSAQTIDEETIKKNLPKMLGANNVGKEFWFTVPPPYTDESGGHDNYLGIFVTSPAKTLVTVEVPGNGMIMTQMTVPNDVIMFKLQGASVCVWAKSGSDQPPEEKVYPGAGVHVYADQPIVVYGVARYYATSDGWLCIPTSSAGSEYICANYETEPMFESWGYRMPTMVGVVSPYDNNKVSFTMAGSGQTSGGLKPGMTTQFSLMRGDVWLVATKGSPSDLAGSKIKSSKPCQVITGNYCNDIPYGNQWCDYCAEMDIPTYVWGTALHVPQMFGRRYPSLIRIFSKSPNTTVYRNNMNIGTLSSGGGPVGKGFFEMRLVPMGQKPMSAVISADKPIDVTLYNCGTQEDANSYNSDPFWMVMEPMEQYQKEITFCTPGLNGVYGFSDNYIALVYETNDLGMMSDSVMFAKVFGGSFNWVKFKNMSYIRDDLFVPVNGKVYGVRTLELPGDGVYKIKSNTPFAAYSFGYDYCDSYGFPTSFTLIDQEHPDTVCPVPTYKIGCDGNTIGGKVTDMPEDVAIRSNLSMINMDPVSSFNYVMDYDPFIPGETRTTQWKLTIINPDSDARAVITFSDRRGNDTTIIINYYAIKLKMTEQIWDYGTLKVNSAQVTHQFTVQNISNGPVFIHKLNLKTNTDFVLTLDTSTTHGKDVPFWLGVDSIFKFTVSFNPDKIGEFKDSIGVGDTCFYWYKSYVHVKTAEPSINVSDIDFKTVKWKSPPKTLPYTITNDGLSDLIITGFTGPTDTKVYTFGASSPAFPAHDASAKIHPRCKPRMQGSRKPGYIIDPAVDAGFRET
jgi:hypothetical protein